MSLPARMTAAELVEYQRTGRLPQRAGAVDPRPKRSKYGVGPRHLRQVDGYTFDSIAEKRRYQELRLQEQAGGISELRVHPCWPLVVNGVPVGEYEADFSYRELRSADLECHGEPPLVVEDVKGVRTAVFRLKKALMLALHGIDVEEVGV